MWDFSSYLFGIYFCSLIPSYHRTYCVGFLIILRVYSGLYSLGSERMFQMPVMRMYILQFGDVVCYKCQLNQND